MGAELLANWSPEQSEDSGIACVYSATLSNIYAPMKVYGAHVLKAVDGRLFACKTSNNGGMEPERWPSEHGHTHPAPSLSTGKHSVDTPI